MARTHAAEEHITFAVTSRNNRRGVASGVLCGSAPRLFDSTYRVMFSYDLCLPRAVEYSRVNWVGEVSQSVRELLQLGRCELLLLEAGSWGTGIVREPRVRGKFAVGSRYQATTGKESRLSRFSACCSELQCVRISDSVMVICSYDL
jgi:hypothetical protein